MTPQSERQSHAFNGFSAFIRHVMPEYVFEPFHFEIIQALRKLEAGEIKRLMINAPPRHGKTRLASILFVAWYLWRNSGEVIMTSYGQEICNDVGQALKDLISSIECHELTGLTLSADSHSKKKFELSNGAKFYGVGRGGAITGRGGNLIVIDDMVKDAAEARSPAVMKETIRFWRDTLSNRMMPNPDEGRVIIMNTRWSVDDLCGYLLKKHSDEWETIVLPAITDQGEALSPQRIPMTALMKAKRTLTNSGWNAQYMQTPVAMGGNIYKKDDFRYYDQLPHRSDEKIQMWDFAFDGKETSDYTVGQVWLRDGANVYLVDQTRDKADFMKGKKMFKALTTKHPDTNPKWIERAANGSAIMSALKDEIAGIQTFPVKESKIARAEAVQVFMESHNVYLPRNAPYLDDLIAELTAFPNVSNDDQVDCVTSAIWKLLSPMLSDGGDLMAGGVSDVDLIDEEEIHDPRDAVIIDEPDDGDDLMMF